MAKPIEFSSARAVTAACLSLATVLAGFVASPARAANTSIVALGDSYSSGTGAGDYLRDGTACLRSLESYSGVIASQHGLDLTLQACAGAVTEDVLQYQMEALDSGTSHVSISIGGNDIGFSKVITECAKPGWMSNCDSAIDNALLAAEQQLPGSLDRVYAAIRQRAPRARVAVAGYPRLFNGYDCHIATFFTRNEMSRLNAAADQLSQVIALAARRHGFFYADVRDAFHGRAVCDSPEWIHNVRVTDTAESFHPKADGYRYGYAPIVADGLGVSGDRSTQGAVTTGGTTSSDTRRGRVYVPDLTGREAKDAARRAGISPSELEALVRAQRSGASNARLERMSVEAAG